MVNSVFLRSLKRIGRKIKTMNSNGTVLKIAVQKSGRLKDDSLLLLKEASIEISNGNNQLKSKSSNFPVEIYFLRDDDIPEYVADQVADIGIVGENIFLEKGKKNALVKRLGFARCRLAIAVPRNTKYTSIKDLNGKQVATSYPVLLQNYLSQNQVSANVHVISGSVEIAPSIGLADAVCDLVSSGSTLLHNGLVEVETILQSEAVLIKNCNLSEEKNLILNQLIFRVDAVLKAKRSKYILLNIPNVAIDKITSIIPGMTSPTIMPLCREGWSSLHSVVDEDDFWNRIDQLKELGAEGILVIPIEKMIP